MNEKDIEQLKLYHKRELIQGLINEGVSKRKIAKIVKVDRNTIDRFIKRFLYDNDNEQKQ